MESNINYANGSLALAGKNIRQGWLVCLGLVISVWISYSPVWRAGFVAFDDNDYVLTNDAVRGGVTFQGIVWAFTHFYASNWHPLTWISHMLDCQLYGTNPAGHHLTNVLLHLASSILLYFVLRRMTKAGWPAALVAFLFAVHPMHVESVAWISERKDVLSGFFFILTLWFYASYADLAESAPERGRKFYFLAIGAFACGLLAKPMLVTVPFVLLLLDAWPLRRALAPRRLLAEKWPFFLLAILSSVVTWRAQAQGGAMASLANVPLRERLENIPVSYVRYLAKTFWPVDLAAAYPLVPHWPAAAVWGSVLLLVFISGAVIIMARRKPFLALGWVWFLGMLVPVIGLIHVGATSMADRYNYLPSIGLFIAVAWLLRAPLRQTRGIPAVLVVAALTLVSRGQAGYWIDSQTIFRHTLAVTRNNGLIENNLGELLLEDGKFDEAFPLLLDAVKYAGKYPFTHYNLGRVYLAKGDVLKALTEFDLHVRLNPSDPTAQFNFGNVLLQNGLAADAVAPLAKAVQLRPNNALNHSKLADAYRQNGQTAKAIEQYEMCLQLLPHDIQASAGLAWLLATTPDPSLRNGRRAVAFASDANQLIGGQEPKILGVLAAAFAEAGRFEEAAATAERAAKLASGNSALARLLDSQAELYRSGKPFREH